jgi:hypothetical protein
MINDGEIAIVSAVSKALQLLDNDPSMPTEEIIKMVMKSVEAGAEAKIHAVAAVNEAIKIKRQFSNFATKQIIQQAVDNYRKSLE